MSHSSRLASVSGVALLQLDQAADRRDRFLRAAELPQPGDLDPQQRGNDLGIRAAGGPRQQGLLRIDPLRPLGDHRADIVAGAEPAQQPQGRRPPAALQSVARTTSAISFLGGSVTAFWLSNSRIAACFDRVADFSYRTNRQRAATPASLGSSASSCILAWRDSTFCDS